MNYEQIIRAFKNERPFTRADLMIPGLSLLDTPKLNVYYAPFDYINAQAKIVIVGITPGWTQMQKAFTVVRETLGEGGSWEAALQAVKRKASFAGSMRKNLVHMLDELGLNKKLNLASCAELYDTHNGLIHSTSFLKYPVFYKGRNYQGTTPSALRAPLWDFVESHFVKEINSFESALVIPLGKSVKQVISKLSDEGKLKGGYSYLEHFPHPSGANGHRREEFEAYRRAMEQQIAAWHY